MEDPYRCRESCGPSYVSDGWGWVENGFGQELLVKLPLSPEEPEAPNEHLVNTYARAERQYRSRWREVASRLILAIKE
ncbi:hypothetical protein HYS84_00690 [Candidatus Saccharibacteria bacterium]|nr:hypothetical protein [Candidatus Saccharibacteria bacterium]